MGVGWQRCLWVFSEPPLALNAWFFLPEEHEYSLWGLVLGRSWESDAVGSRQSVPIDTIGAPTGVHFIWLLGRNDKDGYPLPVIRKYPSMFDGQRIPNYLAPIVAAHRFLSLPFVKEDLVLPGRAERRRLVRESRTIPSVRVVTLRRGLPIESREAGERQMYPPLREWHHSWVVSGHWRKQWYPSERRHRPIWIDPHIKGPSDRPLKLRQATVHRAVR